MTGETGITSSSFSSVITALTSQIDVASVVEVLAYAGGLAVGLAFMWWGVRKALSTLMAAFRKGRISI